MANQPEISCLSIAPTLEVPDVKFATDHYQEKLGFNLGFLWGEPPTHGAVNLNGASIHFGEGTPNPKGFWLYLHVEDLDGLFDWYQSNNVQTLDKPTTQPWGMREFNMRDPHGYCLRFGQSDLEFGDPVPVQRVDVAARIEKRLAALLADLAKHKGLSVSETLEETLLHSFEALPNREGQGVASPHTKRTLEYIVELKSKHGIDYDTHDSYRFREEE